jgi:hypothetical protein
VTHVQQYDGRWVIVDLVGKHHRVCSVPMPTWTKVAIDAWTYRAGITAGRVFRSLRKGDHGAVGAGGWLMAGGIVGANSDLHT